MYKAHRRRFRAHYLAEVASYFFPVRLRRKTTLLPTIPQPHFSLLLQL